MLRRGQSPRAEKGGGYPVERGFSLTFSSRHHMIDCTEGVGLLNGREYLEQQLRDHYDLEARLGRGKLLYRHRGTGDLLVCRSVMPEEDLSAYRRLMGRTHPHLAAVYDVIDDDEAPAVLLEYVPGQSLDRVLGDAPPDAAAVKQMARDICDGLIALHSLEIVHKDLKPENIIITPEGTARLIDFGIATIFGEGRREETSLLGTVGFAAPEQFGFNRTDARTDIYSFGVLLNVLLAHEHPTARQYRRGQPGRIIRRCLSTSPEDRYPTAIALRKALNRW